jgi:hypothetical protein
MNNLFNSHDTAEQSNTTNTNAVTNSINAPSSFGTTTGLSLVDQRNIFCNDAVETADSSERDHFAVVVFVLEPKAKLAEYRLPNWNHATLVWRPLCGKSPAAVVTALGCINCNESMLTQTRELVQPNP